MDATDGEVKGAAHAEAVRNGDPGQSDSRDECGNDGGGGWHDGLNRSCIVCNKKDNTSDHEDRVDS